MLECKDEIRGLGLLYYKKNFYNSENEFTQQ